jgi:PEP-CTERM motif
MMKRYLVPLAALACTVASPATAAAVFVANFDAENGGNSAINYTGFANFTVITPPMGGAVDLVRSGDFGIRCAGGTGSCVDLDGTINSAGGLRTINAFAFGVGDRVTLSFDFSGNQRGGAPDSIFFGFEALGPVDFLNVTASTASGAFLALGDQLAAPGIAFGFADILSGDPFDRLSFSFTAGNAGSIHGLVGDASQSPTNPTSDNVGAIIDNLSIDISPVPEPGSWTLMLAGFGLMGGAIRQGRQRAKLAYS